ncbi:MAG: TlyA family RNA methyltransferase, partial [Acidobacteria bacterium]|nr:TlyA family RNA methyltransferase [Acidobacteriota bacterium]
MGRTRLDQLIVARGLAMSRERAQALVIGNHVTVNGVAITKAGTQVDDDAEIQLKTADHPWVSRGGLKLVRALEAFAIDVTGALALDIGASTGGFTDVMLQHGAARVIAIDVGHNQIDWKLRNDPRVVVREGVNARYLTAADLPDDARAFDLVTIDVSFISLALILPVVPALLKPTGRVVALVKPQFEAGRDEVGKGGIVRDPETHTRVVADVTRAAAA